MLIRTVVVALALAVNVLPALAGVHYTAVTDQEGQGTGAADTTVEGWVDGEKAKILIHESDAPLLEPGTYLLTRDGGSSLILVDPEEETYAAWDLAAMLGMVGGVMQGMKGILDIEVSDPQVEKLVEESGGEMVGLPTTHYRYRTTYTMTMKILMSKRESQVTQEQDLWVTTALTDTALGAWMRKTPAKTGIEGLDKLIDAELAKVVGFPLKTATRTTTRDQKQKETVTTTTQEVTELERTDIDPSTFELPAGYREIQLLPGAPES